MRAEDTSARVLWLLVDTKMSKQQPNRFVHNVIIVTFSK